MPETDGDDRPPDDDDVWAQLRALREQVARLTAERLDERAVVGERPATRRARAAARRRLAAADRPTWERVRDRWGPLAGGVAFPIAVTAWWLRRHATGAAAAAAAFGLGVLGTLLFAPVIRGPLPPGPTATVTQTVTATVSSTATATATETVTARPVRGRVSARPAPSTSGAAGRRSAAPPGSTEAAGPPPPVPSGRVSSPPSSPPEATPEPVATGTSRLRCLADVDVTVTDGRLRVRCTRR